MNAHTKEPWIYQDDYYQGSIGDCTIILSEDTATIAVLPDQCHPNAARIVECVNACAGINPAAVPLLLEDAESLVEWFENCAHLFDDLDTCPGLKDLVADVAQHIAKAREVQP